MEDWKREEGQEEQKEKNYVSRREFYICFLILLAVIFLQGMLTRERIQLEASQLRNGYTNRLDGLENRIDNIPNSIENALLEADNPLRESDMEIVDVDMKGKTATIRMMATPKEYQDGMTVKFFLSCDGAEAMEVPAMAGKDRAFTAEAKVPFCGEAKATVSMQKGDTEAIQNMGIMTIEGQVLPYFNGNWGGSISWLANQKYVTFDGDILVDIQKPDWMIEQKKAFSLKNEKVEVYIDGKKVKTIPAEIIMEDEFTHCYQASVTEENKIQLGEGQEIQFLFKAEDNNGLKYSYEVETGYLTEENEYIGQEPATDLSGGGRLTIE